LLEHAGKLYIIILRRDIVTFLMSSFYKVQV
jgi:hypothetical protein